MLKSIICTGILMLPYTFYIGGYVETTLTLIVVGMLVGYTCICFHKVLSNQTDEIQLNECIKRVLGCKSCCIYMVTTGVFTLGLGVAYFLYIARFSQVVTTLLLGTPLNHLLNILIVAIILFLTTLIRHFDHLKFFSIIGLTVLMLTYLTFTSVGIYNITRHDHQKEEIKLILGNLSELPIIYGQLLYSFELIQSVPYIRSSM